MFTTGPRAKILSGSSATSIRAALSGLVPDGRLTLVYAGGGVGC